MQEGLGPWGLSLFHLEVFSAQPPQGGTHGSGSCLWICGNAYMKLLDVIVLLSMGKDPVFQVGECPLVFTGLSAGPGVQRRLAAVPEQSW